MIQIETSLAWTCMSCTLQGTYVPLTKRSGTGASCIYPLLGCRQRPKWMFGATGSNSNVSAQPVQLTLDSDIDARSLQCARENVARNDLKSRVRLVKTGPDEPLIPLSTLSLDRCVLPVPLFDASTDSAHKVLTSQCVIPHSTNQQKRC